MSGHGKFGRASAAVVAAMTAITPDVLTLDPFEGVAPSLSPMRVRLPKRPNKYQPGIERKGSRPALRRRSQILAQKWREESWNAKGGA